MLPGLRPRADEGGEGQGGQQGEEAEVEQALDAIVADASEGVQVVLRRRGRTGRREGASERHLGSRSSLGPLASPPKHPLLSLKVPGFGAQHNAASWVHSASISCAPTVCQAPEGWLGTTQRAAGFGEQSQVA